VVYQADDFVRQLTALVFKLRLSKLVNGLFNLLVDDFHDFLFDFFVFELLELPLCHLSKLGKQVANEEVADNAHIEVHILSLMLVNVVEDRLEHAFVPECTRDFLNCSLAHFKFEHVVGDDHECRNYSLVIDDLSFAEDRGNQTLYLDAFFTDQVYPVD